MAPGTDPIMFMLPTGLNTREKSACKSMGYTGLPTEVSPLEAEKEAEVLLQLIKELNVNFCLELSDDIEVADKCWVTDTTNEGDKAKKFILVGCSHVARLALAMEDAGHEVSTVLLPGYHLTEDSVLNAKMQLDDLVKDADPGTTVVYFMYDNNVYKSKNEDGVVGPPTKLRGSSKYHVIGELCTVTHGEFKTVFNLSVALLRAGGDLNKIVLSPLVRYAQGPCCDEQGHCVNFGDPSYREMLGEAMAHLESWVKDFTFSKRIRNFKVLSATEAVTISKGKILKNRELKANLGTDPVHLPPDGYAKLASVIVEQVDCAFTRAKRKLLSGEQKQRVSSLCNKRQKWILEDDITANRSYGQNQRGGFNNRGQRGVRGQRGRGGQRGGQRGRGFFRAKFYRGKNN
jgi:hypothetical protein